MSEKFPIVSEYDEVVALQNFDSQQEDVLSFREGDTFRVISKGSQYAGWWVAKINNRVGFVPERLVRLVVVSGTRDGQDLASKLANRLKVDSGSVSDSFRTNPTSGQKLTEQEIYASSHPSGSSGQYEIKTQGFQVSGQSTQQESGISTGGYTGSGQTNQSGNATGQCPEREVYAPSYLEKSGLNDQPIKAPNFQGNGISPQGYTGNGQIDYSQTTGEYTAGSQFDTQTDFQKNNSESDGQTYQTIASKASNMVNALKNSQYGGGVNTGSMNNYLPSDQSATTSQLSPVSRDSAGSGSDAVFSDNENAPGDQDPILGTNEKQQDSASQKKCRNPVQVLQNARQYVRSNHPSVEKFSDKLHHRLTELAKTLTNDSSGPMLTSILDETELFYRNQDKTVNRPLLREIARMRRYLKIED